MYIGDMHVRIKVDLNIAPVVRDDIHGHADKSLIVLHETVSPNYPGLADLIQTSNYLDSKGLGVHGVTDIDGNLAWAVGERRAILYHAASGEGRVNTRSIGIEQVSRVMLDLPDNYSRWRKWWGQGKQIDILAQLLAFLSHTEGIPLRYSNASVPGITSHWDVSRTYNVPGGHWDCWPKHRGGYYPILRVIDEAVKYHRKWYAEE